MNQRRLKIHVKMIALPFQVTLKGFNLQEIIDYIKVPLALVKRFEQDTLCKTIVDGNAYA